MEPKNCAVTGHRDIPDDKVDFIKQRLREEVQLAIDDGCRFFLSGMADGADLLFVEVVIELKETNPGLFLEAALPYANRNKTGNERFQELLKECDGVNIVSEKYFPGCFMKRNRYLIEHSQRVIAVYDGRKKGGTFFTMRHAKNMELDVRVIEY